MGRACFTGHGVLEEAKSRHILNGLEVCELRGRATAHEHYCVFYWTLVGSKQYVPKQGAQNPALQPHMSATYSSDQDQWQVCG